MCYTDAYICRTDEGEGHLKDSLPRSLRYLETSLADVWHEFDVIVVSGLSGVIPGSILAHKHEKQLVVIRKDEDVCHGVRTEGRDYFPDNTPYIILDDFISSGATMRRMIDTMEMWEYGLPKYIALYRGSWPCNGVILTGGTHTLDARHVKGQLYAPFLEKGIKI